MLTVVAGAKLHLLFWIAYNAYNKHVHKQAMEAIKKELMVYKIIANIFKVAKTLSGCVVPKVKLLLTKTELESRSSIVTFHGRGMFEVLDDSSTFTVNIVEYYCDCMRGRPPSDGRRGITEKRKVHTQSNTLRCSKSKQFGHTSRSHREGNVLKIRRGKDKLRKLKVRLRGALQRRQRQPKLPKIAMTSSQLAKAQPSLSRETSSKTASSRQTRSQTTT
ncbi:hypothetical protein Cgig2_016383 [Carnegiea gigantea]|uniref:Uncharacterized protein n=1 Tax=Carnegiea gigantea TaxID=171969 RepID=A0A9Q1K8I0_9CARY|nr:hypothetical protein Cgig2_016383 [Carnegiea gigantea]